MNRKLNSVVAALSLAALFLSVPDASAQSLGDAGAKGLAHSLGYLGIFAAVGTIALIAGFKVFDRVITRIDFEEEILKGNIAAGIFAGAMVIGISIIIAVSMM